VINRPVAGLICRIWKAHQLLGDLALGVGALCGNLFQACVVASWGRRSTGGFDYTTSRTITIVLELLTTGPFRPKQSTVDQGVPAHHFKSVSLRLFSRLPELGSTGTLAWKTWVEAESLTETTVSANESHVLHLQSSSRLALYRRAALAGAQHTRAVPSTGAVNDEPGRCGWVYRLCSGY